MVYVGAFDLVCSRRAARPIYVYAARGNAFDRERHPNLVASIRAHGPVCRARRRSAAARAHLGDKVDLADLNLNGPRLMPGYDLSFRSGSRRLNTIGLFYEVETQIASAEDAFTLGPLAVLPGQRTSSDLTYTQLDFRIARTVLDTPLSPLSEGPGHKVRVRVDAELGLRLYDFEFRFENLDTGDRTSYGRTFYEPHVGAKAAFNIHERATIDLYTNFGYWPFDREAFSWDIGVGFQWRPVENVGLQIGYRSTIFLLQEGSGAASSVGGSFQGLNAGIQIRF